MSERYGTPGELKEVLSSLEDYCREAIDAAEVIMRSGAATNTSYDAGRMQAMRDVLDFIISNPGG